MKPEPCEPRFDCRLAVMLTGPQMDAVRRLARLEQLPVSIWLRRLVQREIEAK